MTKMERLQARLDAAREKMQEAKRAESEIKKEMRAESVAETARQRRLETQRLCTLGRAWMSLSDKSEKNREFMQSFLNSYISRDVDRAVLRGTHYAVDSVSSDEASQAETEYSETY